MNSDIPAFPGFHIDGATTTIWGGMTLRDYFAAAALHNVGHQLTDSSRLRMDLPSMAPIIAKLAYEIADAMLAERDK